MSQKYDYREVEYAATAVAAAAFAIRSLEQTDHEFQFQRKIKIIKEDTSVTPSRRYSRKDTKNAADNASSMNKRTSGQDRKTLEGAFRASKSHQSPAGAGQMLKGNPTRRGVENKADAWEKAEMEKIRKWNEKMKSTILAWESDKKTRTKRQMERRKAELEQRKLRNMQHYQHKIANIENIAGGAIVQMEERRISKESEVKDKANKIRSTGEVPIVTSCFCF